MDRRQRKTREAIFKAFTQLLSKKDVNKITVAEIVQLADVGRATFYSHFETKDDLLNALCEDLFCHLFDAEQEGECDHKHVFTCDRSEPVFLHLFRHLQKNDNNILLLLSSRNNELFLKCFRTHVERLADTHTDLFASLKGRGLPQSFLKNYISSTFVETVRWWICNGIKESPEQITQYFFKII